VTCFSLLVGRCWFDRPGPSRHEVIWRDVEREAPVILGLLRSPVVVSTVSQRDSAHSVVTVGLPGKGRTCVVGHVKAGSSAQASCAA
jgi:hypothetical protein